MTPEELERIVLLLRSELFEVPLEEQLAYLKLRLENMPEVPTAYSKAVVALIRTGSQAAENAARVNSDTNSLVFVQGDLVMHREDKYNITGQAGAVGPGSHAHGMTFNQIWNELGSQTDTTQLASELTQLRNELLKRASEPDHFIAIGEVAAAEKAATAKDGPKALQHLKTAGKWVFDVATQIGTTLAAEVLKKSLGIQP